MISAFPSVAVALVAVGVVAAVFAARVVKVTGVAIFDVDNCAVRGVTVVVTAAAVAVEKFSFVEAVTEFSFVVVPSVVVSARLLVVGVVVLLIVEVFAVVTSVAIFVAENGTVNGVAVVVTAAAVNGVAVVVTAAAVNGVATAAAVDVGTFAIVKAVTELSFVAISSVVVRAPLVVVDRIVLLSVEVFAVVTGVAIFDAENSAVGSVAVVVTAAAVDVGMFTVVEVVTEFSFVVIPSVVVSPPLVAVDRGVILIVVVSAVVVSSSVVVS